MPSASVITAMIENSGFLASMRTPKRKSCKSVCIPLLFVAQRNQRIDFCRASRRDVTRQQSDDDEHGRHCNESWLVGWCNSEEQRGQQTSRRHRSRYAKRQTKQSQPLPFFDSGFKPP